MKLNLKSSLSQKKTLLILSLLCLLLGAIAILLGDILVPGTVAILALIFLFDSPKNTFGIITSAALVVLNGLALAFGLTVSLFGPETIILAFILTVAFGKKSEKSETALIMTAIATLFTAASIILIPFNLGDAKNFSEVASFYGEFIESFRVMLVDATMEIYKPITEGSGIEISQNLLVASVNRQLSLVISYAVISCFAIIGISMKIFEAIMSRLSEDKNIAINWRFMTNNVFAYFYIALIILSILTTTSGGILSITIGNLYNIFMVVYAYVGFNYMMALLSIKLKPLTALIILAVATLLAMSLTLQILAAFGVLFTIRKNKEVHVKEE